MIVRNEPARLRLVRIRMGSSGLDTLVWTSTKKPSSTTPATNGPITRDELHPAVAASPSP